MTISAVTDALVPGAPALRHSRPLRRLLAALAVSCAGDWLYNLALLAFVYGRTSSAGWVAATTAARVVPAVVLGPLGGALADRHDRRRLMIAADVVRTAAMLALALVAATTLPVLLAPALAALSTAASVVYPPSVAATLPRLVQGEDLAGANAARSMIGSASLVVGPAAGGVLLLAGPVAYAFLINAATFALSAIFVLAMTRGTGAEAAETVGADLFRAPCTSESTGGLLDDLRAGASALREHPIVSAMFGADVLCSVMYGAQTVLLLMLARRLGAGESAYGWMIAATGAGGVVGTVLAGRLAATPYVRRALAIALGLVAASAVGLAVTPSLAGLLVLCMVGGAGSLLVEVCADTVLQRSLDEAVLGRAYGLAFPASIAGIVLGSAVAAPLAALLGASGALISLAGVLAVYAVWVGSSRRSRHAVQRPSTASAMA